MDTTRNTSNSTGDTILLSDNTNTSFETNNNLLSHNTKTTTKSTTIPVMSSTNLININSEGDNGMEITIKPVVCLNEENIVTGHENETCLWRA